MNSVCDNIITNLKELRDKETNKLIGNTYASVAQRSRIREPDLVTESENEEDGTWNHAVNRRSRKIIQSNLQFDYMENTASEKETVEQLSGAISKDF